MEKNRKRFQNCKKEHFSFIQEEKEDIKNNSKVKNFKFQLIIKYISIQFCRLKTQEKMNNVLNEKYEEVLKGLHNKD